MTQARFVSWREKLPLFKSLCIFGAVGVAASVTHATVGILLVRNGILEPFKANILAFLTAFVVSYVGHYSFSFRSDAAHGGALTKFFLVAVLGLAMNQMIVLIVVNWQKLPYELALGIVFLTVPVSTYLLSRFWAFRSTENA